MALVDMETEKVPHSDIVYVFYEDDVVIWVGRTRRIRDRLAEHRYDKPWWDEVDRIDVIRMSSHDAALRGEKGLIDFYRPRWNVVDNPGPLTSDDLAGREGLQHGICLDCGQVDVRLGRGEVPVGHLCRAAFMGAFLDAALSLDEDPS